jgi:hypothetical protein
MSNKDIAPGVYQTSVFEVDIPQVLGIDLGVAPDTVPEWRWIQANATFVHPGNGLDPGVWEFILNLGLDLDDAPEKLAPVINQARQNGASYLIAYQG